MRILWNHTSYHIFNTGIYAENFHHIPVQNRLDYNADFPCTSPLAILSCELPSIVNKLAMSDVTCVTPFVSNVSCVIKTPRRQVVWVARQVLDLTLGDAIDDLLLSHIQGLRTASSITALLESLQQVGGSCCTALHCTHGIGMHRCTCSYVCQPIIDAMASSVAALLESLQQMG